MTTKEKKELEVAGKLPLAETNGEPTREGVYYTPQVDIVEDNDAITLYADLPGVTKEGVSIDVHEGVLTLTATTEPLSSQWQPVWKEYEVGGYTRKFSLSDRVDTEKINAKIENGVLALTLPKAESQKPRKIKIV